MNLYAYVGADPVNFTDPSGLMTRAECKARQDAERAKGEAGVGVVCGGGGGFGAFGDFGGGWGMTSFSAFGGGSVVPQVPTRVQAADLLKKKPKTKPKLPRCIASSAGPVTFVGGGSNVTLGTGGGVEFFRFEIRSIGAFGYVRTESLTGGLGASLGASVGIVDRFGNFLGDGYRISGDAAFGVGGDYLFGSNGQHIGGAVSFGPGVGGFGGKTNTKLLSSNIPTC